MIRPSIANDSGSVVFVSNRKARLYRLRKSVYNAGEEIEANIPAHWNCYFVTLTYREVGDWKPNHIRDFLHRVRMWLARRGYKLHYVWVAELQKRGAVHYHILVWLPPGIVMPKPDAFGWWPHGSTNRDISKKRTGYLMKYVSKGEKEGKKFPKGIRIYGYSRHFETISRRVSYYRAPLWLRNNFSDYKNCYLVRKTGFWVDKLTGECFETSLQYSFYRYHRRYKGVILVCPALCSSYVLDEVNSFLPKVGEFENEN